MAARDVFQGQKLGLRLLRYELSDYEWTAIKPMIPNKPNGAWRDRCLLSLALGHFPAPPFAENERSCPRQPLLEWKESADPADLIGSAFLNGWPVRFEQPR
jgi:hypothetical protein